jgi:hypothetical protein
MSGRGPSGGRERSNGAVVRDHLRTELVRFVRALRDAGAAVPANAATIGARALLEVGLEDRGRVRTALRASLLTDREDFETFDRLFGAFWGRLTTGFDTHGWASDADAPPGETGSLDVPGDASEPGEAPGIDGTADDAGNSSVESFAARGTGTDTGEEAATALYSPSGRAGAVGSGFPVGSGGLGPAFRDLTRSLAGLRGRRFGPGGETPDVRRALRSSVSTGGTLLSVPRRERRPTAVRALLLIDVSRSVLDTVDRGFLVDVLRMASREWRDVRVFFFDEDLREVTEAVDAPSASAALAALEATEAEWGGGTRIGRSLATLRRTAPEAVDRRTVVFVLSDGLEMGEIDVLERELSWLARTGERVFWLNPLAVDERYEPTARGMAAALPYLDALFAFGGPEDVAELAGQLRRQGPGGRIGYEFDSRRLGHSQTTTTTDNHA